MALTVGVEHDLGALGEGVVVLRAHGGAVRARALDDDLVRVRVRVRVTVRVRVRARVRVRVRVRVRGLGFGLEG